MNKFAFTKKIELLKISKLSFGLGILLGLTYAFAFYSIFYMSRESLRIFSIKDDFNLWIFTREEVKFYNLFFAFLSLIIGQSICIQFWVDRGRKFKSNYKERLTTIINDQRVLIWYFLSWFSKLAFVFAFVFVITLEGDTVFNFYQEYKYIFILFLIVLFLQSWITIRRVFKRNSLKWMVISFSLISILSIGLSNINLVDYQKFNKAIINKNICYKFNIEIPRINNVEDLTQPYLIQKIYLAQNNSTTLPALIFEDKLIELDSLADLVIEKVDSFHNQRLRNRLKYQLYIDKDIPMKHVKELTIELSKANIFKINFSALPTEPKFKLSYYRNHSISHYIPISVLELPHQNDTSQNSISVEIIDHNKVLIDSINLKAELLGEAIKDKIERESINEIVIYFKETSKFDTYIKVLSLSKDAINQLRNEYSLKNYFSEFDYLPAKERFEVIKKYNVIIVDSMEISSDFID